MKADVPKIRNTSPNFYKTIMTDQILKGWGEGPRKSGMKVSGSKILNKDTLENVHKD